MEKDKLFISGLVSPTERAEPAWWFASQGDKLLVHLGVSSVSIPCLVDFTELGLTAMRQHYLGRLDDRHCFVVKLAEGIAPPEGMAFQGLLQVHDRLDEDLPWLAGRAVQIVDWDRTHQFCGQCGIRYGA